MQKRIFNQLNNFRALWLAFGLAFPMSAADFGKPAHKAMAESIAQQRRAVSSMAAPLEAQRRSVRKQAGGLPAGSFFSLPPLAPLPPVSGSVANWEPAPVCPPLPESELAILVDQAAEQENL